MSEANEVKDEGFRVMNVLSRFQRRFPMLIHKIFKCLLTVTRSDQRGPKFSEDLFSNVKIPIVVKIFENSPRLLGEPPHVRHSLLAWDIRQIREAALVQEQMLSECTSF